MKIKIFITFICMGLLTVSCIKNNARGETYLADGSWKIEKVKITAYDSTGAVENTAEINDAGFIMLTHEDELLYEGSYSFNISSQEFMDESPMYFLFTDPLAPANTWQVTNYAKAFNLSFSGEIQGFYTFEPRATFTITKLGAKKFELLYIRTHPDIGTMAVKEEWKMVRATH